DLTHTRGDIYRALFEGIACATNHVFETYVDAGQEPRCLLAAGGGVQNRVWAQATSDISGRRQRVREKTLGASYGDAFLAALAIGDVRRGDIRTWNPVAHEIIPDPTTRDIYEHRYRTFRALYPRTRDLMQCRLSVKSGRVLSKSDEFGGEGGIRTHGTVTRTTVFEF